MWIEVFRTGTFADSLGREESYTAEKIDEISRIFNTEVLEKGYLAPLVKGHPKNDEPAHGWIERLARRGNKMVAKLMGLTPEIIKEISEGRFKRISIALSPELLLRHVGLLGAVQPAVSGLRAVEFEQDFGGSFVFDSDFSISEENQIVLPPVAEQVEFLPDVQATEFKHSDEANTEHDTKQELEYKSEVTADVLYYYEKENRELKTELTQLKRQEKNHQYQTKFVQFFDKNKYFATNSEIIEEGVNLLMRAESDRQTDSEYSAEVFNPLEIIDFIKLLKPKDLFREIKAASKPFDEEGNFAGRNVDENRMNSHFAAQELMYKNPNLSYEQAINQIL